MMLHRPEVSSSNAEGGQLILLADDEASMRMVMERRLQSWGYAVVTAQDGRQAVELAQTHPPDLILLDVMMPQLDGLSACRILKAAEATRHIPIVIITAKDSKDLPQETKAAGADGFLQKPYDFAELRAMLKQLAGGTRPDPMA